MTGDDNSLGQSPKASIELVIDEVHASLRDLLTTVEQGGPDSDRLEASRLRSDAALNRLREASAFLTEVEREPLRERVRGAARLNRLIAVALERERTRIRGELSKTRRAVDLLRGQRQGRPPGGSCNISG